MKYYIFTLGCQQNVHDSLRLKKLLDKLGFIEVNEKLAEAIFVLACSVRESAVSRIFGKLKNWRERQVFISGCVLPADKKKFAKKGIEFFDIDDLNTLKPILSLRIGGDLNLLADSQKESAYLPIMTGCNNFCSYCAVPYTRGREKSRSIEEVVNDFQKLLSAGHREITLLGQNVNSYNPKHMGSLASTREDNDHGVISNPPAGGEESPVFNNVILSPEGDPLGRSEGSTNFPKLLKILNDLPGDFTIKFLTNHPKDMSDELIKTIASLPKVAKEIHLPLQSGSSKILNTMNRRYTKDHYLSLVSKIRKEIPDVVLSTDIIVGYPGETEEDFNDSVDVAKKCDFAIAYIAKYSPRSSTVSAKEKDDVPLDVKKERFKILDSLINNKHQSIP